MIFNIKLENERKQLNLFCRQDVCQWKIQELCQWKIIDTIKNKEIDKDSKRNNIIQSMKNYW